MKEPATAKLFRGLPVERAQRELDEAAFDLWLMSLLLADERGHVKRADLQRDFPGTVGWDRLDDGSVRVWYRP